MAGRSLKDQENERLRALLRRLIADGKTQAEIGKAIGVEQGSISGFLKGGHGSSYGTARKAARYAKVSISTIIDADDEAPIDPFDAGASTALVDGALAEDVEKARRQLAEKRVTWLEAREKILAARAVREEAARVLTEGHSPPTAPAARPKLRIAPTPPPDDGPKYDPGVGAHSSAGRAGEELNVRLAALEEQASRTRVDAHKRTTVSTKRKKQGE